MVLRKFYAALMLIVFLIPCTGGAIDSGPSNTVGFWKLEVQPGFTQVSFPLLPDDKTVNDVLGDQLTGGSTPEQSDQILRWDAQQGNFQVCWYNTTTGNWEGGFSELSESESYWIYVQPDHPVNQTIVTFGNVIEEPSFNMGQIIPGYNAVGSVWAVPAAIIEAGLEGFEGGLYLFLSDIISSYDASTNSYSYAWQNEGGNWQGNLTEFEPLKGYWIYIAPGHTGFNWSEFPQPTPPGLDYLEYPGLYPIDTSNKNGPVNPPHPTVDVIKKSINSPAQPASAKGGAQ